MINGYKQELSKIYEEIRNKESNLHQKRIEEIKNKYPYIIELDNTIQKKCLGLSLAILRGNISEEDISNLKDEIMDLRAKKCETLVSLGYSPDYLALHYQCNKCNDTGYIHDKQCNCYKNKLVTLYYKDSDLEDAVKLHNFDTFDLSLFSNNHISEDKYSPRKNMENILHYILKNYISSFSNHNDNLLFYGNSGTGKTFLSNCIAKELLDQGYLVVYKTSDELIRAFRDIKFNKKPELEDMLINCDLLIIDDLGAEQITDFSSTEFFTLLNKKILKKKKMLISTNLTLSMISQLYSERISSRLLGNFKLYKFYTDDIRIQLNLKKSNKG